MFGLPRRSDPTTDRRTETQDYLRDITPLVEKIDQEFDEWIDLATEDARTLVLERDPDGQHASVYLWRVGEAATEIVQRDPPKAANHFHEALSLCLENRGAAADIFRDAATLAALKDPGSRIAEANRRLADAARHKLRADTALKRIESSFL